MDQSNPPTCIVIDVQLPGMSADLQERLSIAGSAPPIFATTSRHEMVIQERAQPNGCAALFRKPVDGDTLTATIASITNP